MELVSRQSVPASKNLVFTSAGDRSNLDRWLTGKRDFDLWVVYYGDVPGRYRDIADVYLPHKGSKFQNLHYCFAHWGQRLNHYDAIMAADDDILIDATGMTRLFEIRQRYDLWALSPAFRSTGLVSWDITRLEPTARLRYTNFIETTAPLFRTDKLEAFMRVYDPQLVGYGTDWWFLHTLGRDIQRRIAVVDEVPCINPFTRTKGGIREIDRLQSHDDKKLVWERIKAAHGLPEIRSFVEYGRIEHDSWHKLINTIRYFPENAYADFKKVVRRLVRPKP